ncbi:hypothetical protein BDV98DRAFT_568088 [Pterulicium gracile]|uniref:Uncharacterized protein n=1 Tax=Pterulicium gracile TaxID=1884261 RepID=A0A5C3QJB6_9AGAR|nr:hypothetical protein BDV98DRAFT_568088 [Pterula gracilis]
MCFQKVSVNGDRQFMLSLLRSSGRYNSSSGGGGAAIRKQGNVLWWMGNGRDETWVKVDDLEQFEPALPANAHLINRRTRCRSVKLLIEQLQQRIEPASHLLHAMLELESIRTPIEEIASESLVWISSTRCIAPNL